MQDAVLEQELARLVSRLRSIGGPRLAAVSVPPFTKRADAINHLVRELVVVADEAHGFPSRLDDVLLGDQLAVVGGDALRTLRSRGSADEVLFVLGEVVLHRFDLDGSLPKGDAITALGGGDVVARLRARCPAGGG
ncbi:hypothetical protein acdb102_05800 [Acidothermaceae bacterium B102]|nr:hypothetical protein acdb102_05800 [Acidothermaceae bacterium B102]